ncbi:amino acid adenylation domain-containing protein [Actinokineospora guangxiensis]|uniref:Phenyloxazoline synthase MbtB n=1 Tax=Actinokineospora guangxiensis TaxID=1490288 RepID=A0ABW0EWZ4_9PSEU
MNESTTSVVDMLRAHCAAAADRTLVVEAGPGGTAVATLTGASWDLAARRVAARLRSASRVLLLPGNDVRFCTALAGSLYAGACAIPVQPPTAHRDSFVDIALDADVDAVVADAATTLRARALWEARGAPGVEWVVIEETEADEPVAHPRQVDPESPALLLYSSGTTGTPKGTVVPHRLLRTWVDVLADRAGLPEGGSVVSWAPVHHVLGLNFVLLAAHRRGQLTLLVPEDVLAEPREWLAAVASAPAPVLSGAPPIGYRRCVEALPGMDTSGIDLSGWSVAIIGSERIDPALIDEFADGFAGSGFRRSAFFPAYGTTDVMMGTGGLRPDGPRAVRVDTAKLEKREVQTVPDGGAGRAIDLLACGTPGKGTRLLLVDPETAEPVARGAVGEIWLSGASVAPGYWRRPADTERVFGARLADGSGPYLRTGDLGFDLDGELVVCGRLSELLVVRGRNLSPHDVERSVRAVRPSHRAAAFTVVRQDRDLLVVLAGAGPHDDAAAVAATARRAVVAEHDIDPDTVLAVPDEAIPLTHNGKVRRAACRAAFLAGHLDGTDAEPEVGGGAPDPVALLVADVLGEQLPSDAEDTPLVRLGLDSMRLISLRSALARVLGLRVPMPELAGTTVNALRGSLTASPAAAQPAAPESAPGNDDVARHEPFPLTELQHAYFVGRSGGYALSGVGTQFYGEFDAPDLDPERLANAWRTVVARHGALRSVIRSDGTQQVLHDPGPVELPVVDLRDKPPGAESAIREEMSRRTFADDEWPPFDIRVLLLPDGTQRVCVALDLLVMDLWSLHIISAEWESAYRGAPLPPQPRFSFREYVLAADPDPDEVERARRYWHDRLADLPPGPTLPLATAPSALTGPPRFTRRSARVRAPEWARVVDRARAEGLTPAAVLIACHAAVLAAWGARRRFTLSLPTFGRKPVHPDVDRVVGDFTSVTLLEVEVDAEDSLVALAGRVQRRLMADLDHTAYGGVAVLRDLARLRGDGGEVFAPVVFASASGHAARGARTPLRWLGEQAHGVSQTPQVLLDHQVFEDADGLEYNWDCVEEAFRPGVLDAMFAAHTALLRALAEPDGAAWSAALPDPRPVEQVRMVERANATAAQRPGGLLADRFLAQADRDPTARAIVADDAVLDYGTLRDRCRALAARLAAAGAGPGSVVAVRLPKSAAQVVAAIAITMTGAAYLPLDPGLPVARRDLLLRRARCALAVGPDDDLPAPVRAVPVDLDACAADIPPCPAHPDDPAYVIFTSGSTGEPKGVVVSHAAAVNTCVDVCERFGVGPGDAVLGLSSLSFDLSVWDVFGVLGAGAALVLPREDDRRDPARWWELVREHRVTVWNSVPALAEMFADYPGGPIGPRLRLALLSGDWIPLDLPGKLARVATEVRVVSMGGATEAAIWSIAHEVAEVDPGWDSVPYGTAMRNQTVHVLDDRMRECPVHVTGELYIGGAGVAHGYLGDTGRTAERFVVHPRWGTRLYRTGDLGRWRPEGFIEFLGREDGQVKVGGYRIELGEVESALAACPGVESAVAAATGDRHARRLVAAVVRTASTPPGLPGDAELLSGVDKAGFLLARHGRRTDLGGAGTALATSSGTPSRSSRREFADRPVPVADLAAALEVLRAHEGPGLPKFAYGSAGSAYAVQTYLHVRAGAIAGLAGGVYYHDPDTHTLLPVAEADDLRPGAGLGVPAVTASAAAFTAFLVADHAAIRPLYGSRARDFCLIEAGLMTQLLEDAAPRHGIGLCQSGVHDPRGALRAALGLGDDHEIVHAVVGGALLPDGVSSRAPETDERFTAQVRAALSRALPAYMVPSTVEVVPALPLTPTGKVDRAAVASRSAAAVPAPHHEPAEGPVEEVLAAALAAELGRPAPATARFLDLGADSAVLVRFYRAAKAGIGVEFPLVAVFEHGTVRDLAHYLSARLTTALSAAPDAELARENRRAAARRAARGGVRAPAATPEGVIRP